MDSCIDWMKMSVLMKSSEAAREMPWRSIEPWWNRAALESGTSVQAKGTQDNRWWRRRHQRSGGGGGGERGMLSESSRQRRETQILKFKCH